MRERTITDNLRIIMFWWQFWRRATIWLWLPCIDRQVGIFFVTKFPLLDQFNSFIFSLPVSICQILSSFSCLSFTLSIDWSTKSIKSRDSEHSMPKNISNINNPTKHPNQFAFDLYNLTFFSYLLAIEALFPSYSLNVEDF